MRSSRSRVDASDRGGDACKRAAVLWPRRLGRAEVHVCGADSSRCGGESLAQPGIDLPQLLRNVQIRILRGRSFTDADREGALNVAIVSEDVAARTWPGDDPIGKRLKMGGPDSEDPWRTVVGVAEPTRYRELAKARSTLYLPAKQFLTTARMLVVRSTASLSLIASLSQEHVRAVDPNVQVIRAAPFSHLLDGPLARPRFNASLVGLFAIAAVFLATVGLYAVIAAYVRQRDREIGIRVALGATAANVRILVLTEALRCGGCWRSRWPHRGTCDDAAGARNAVRGRLT